MRANPVRPELIAHARDKNLYVVQLCITGEYRRRKDGGIAITGAYTKKSAKELKDFINDWYQRADTRNRRNRRNASS